MPIVFLRLRVEAHVGHHFPQSDSAIAPERIADFRLLSTCRETPLRDCKIEETALVTEAMQAQLREAGFRVQIRQVEDINAPPYSLAFSRS